MKQRILIFCITVIVICLWLLLQHSSERKNGNGNVSMAMPANQAILPSAESSNENPTQNPTPKPSPVLIATMKQRATPEASNEMRQKVIEAWQMPLDFYGAVVDEKTNPVEGASATFEWMETPAKEGERTKTVASDVNGRFSLEGQRGPSLSVSVSKAGYYSSRSDITGFSYGDLTSGKNASSFLDPVVFHLHKKGQGAELITSQYGIQSNVSVLVPRDNSPVQVDLLQKKTSATGQLEISQIKPPPPFQTATNWSFRMSIPDGGFIENNDDFQFEAPRSGYQPTVEYGFTKGGTNWTTQVSKQFYINFDGKYGWLRIDSNLAQETVFLTYAINPDGSRNLEPK